MRWHGGPSCWRSRRAGGIRPSLIVVRFLACSPMNMALTVHESDPARMARPCDVFSEKSGCPAAASDLGGVVAVALYGKPREVNSRVDLELCEHLPQVCVHGVRRHEEPFGDRAIGKAGGHELSDGQL